ARAEECEGVPFFGMIHLGSCLRKSRQQKAIRVVESAPPDPTLRQNEPREHGSAPRPVPVDALNRRNEIAEQSLGIGEPALTEARLRFETPMIPGAPSVQGPGAREG